MTIAIVTGGSAGIGKSAAIELARQGAGVILTYNSRPEGAEETVTEIGQLGGTAVALPLNLGDASTFPAFREEVVRVLAETWQATTLSALVNNAGVGKMSLFEDVTKEFFDDLVNVIYKGPYFLTQALLPLLEDGGAIVNVTSTSSTTSTEPGYSVYGSMKSALAASTRYLAKELGGRGIRVNSVAPGTTRTRISDDAFAKHPEMIPEIAAHVVLGRIGEPEDIGKVIAFLASDGAAWITAQDIEVSGGQGL